jgi:hypothetical protein
MVVVDVRRSLTASGQYEGPKSARPSIPAGMTPLDEGFEMFIIPNGL